MKKAVLLVIMLGAALLMGSIAASAEELAPGHNACVDKAAGDFELRECLGKAYDYWDKILNSNYKQAIKDCADSEHPDACKSSLVKAQKLWVQYKEAMTQAIIAMGAGGTMDMVIADGFAADETKKQAKLLAPGN